MDAIPPDRSLWTAHGIQAASCFGPSIRSYANVHPLILTTPKMVDETLEGGIWKLGHEHSGAFSNFRKNVFCIYFLRRLSGFPVPRVAWRHVLFLDLREGADKAFSVMHANFQSVTPKIGVNNRDPAP